MYVDLKNEIFLTCFFSDFDPCDVFFLQYKVIFHYVTSNKGKKITSRDQNQTYAYQEYREEIAHHLGKKLRHF